MTLFEQPSDVTDHAVKTSAPLTFWRVTFAVMLGNVFAGLIGVLIYEAVTH